MLRAEKSDMAHLRGVSGDMSRKRQDGTWEALANCTGSEPEQKDFSYKETKWESVGRESDEAIVLVMSMQQNMLGGKGLC